MIETFTFNHKNKNYQYTIEPDKDIDFFKTYDGKVGSNIIFKIELILPLLRPHIIAFLDNYIVEQRKKKLKKLK